MTTITGDSMTAARSTPMPRKRQRKVQLGRPVVGDEAKQRYQVMLEPRIAEALRDLGDDNLSAGIAIAATSSDSAPKRDDPPPVDPKYVEALEADRVRLEWMMLTFTTREQIDRAMKKETPARGGGSR